MRYLRMLTNSALSGLLGAAYVGVLILQLNPRLPIAADPIAPLVGSLALFYGANLTVLFYALIVVRQLFADAVLSPGWVSVKLLAWLTGLTAATAAVITWLNAESLGVALDAQAARRMALGSGVLAAGAVALLTMAVTRHVIGQRSGRAGAALLGTIVILTVLVPVAIRGLDPAGPRPSSPALQPSALESGVGPPPGRIVLVGVDGASLDYISTAVAQGRLANFGRMLDTGAAMHLTTLRPTQAAPVWTTIASGKLPPQSGIRAAATYRLHASAHEIELLPDLCFAHAMVRFGFLAEMPRVPSDVQAPLLWEILNRYGVSVGIVGWPLTHPASEVHGYLVSDRLHVAGAGVAGDEGPVYPRTLLVTALAAVDEPREPSGSPVAIDTAQESFLKPDPGRAPSARDASYLRVHKELGARVPTVLTSVRFDGLDAVGHMYLRYALPQAFGDVSENEQQRLGRVLDGYYGFIDEQLGTAMASLAPGDLLLVVSGFGMTPVSLGKRLLATVLGDPDLSGSHEAAPDGFLLAYGTPVAAGRLPVGMIADVAPTILYFLGLPVGRDMDGDARTDLFTREFTAERPITVIPSHGP